MANRSVPAPLPIWEQCLYWITECVTIFYMFYSLYHASDDARRKNEPIEIDDGWDVIGRPMDIADVELANWSSYCYTLLPWICGQVVLSSTSNLWAGSLKLKAVVFTVYGFLAACYVLGFWTVVVFCVLPVVLYLVAKLRRASLVWVTSLLFLTFLNFREGAIFQWVHGYYPNSEVNTWFYVCIFVWGVLFQKATAFALECVWAQQFHLVSSSQTEENMNNADCVQPPVPDPLPQVPSWLDMFFYIFYFPLFFTGPLMIYSKFHRQFKEPQKLTKRRMQGIVWKLLRIVFWGVMNFVVLHYIYPHALNSNRAVLAQQSRMTIAAIGYSLGQLFMVKYLVLYGLPAQLARLDGIEPPVAPACISYIYCYSDMWRSFDRGLYDFMKRYIFIPVGGSQAGLVYRVIGSILCFAFVYYWHGAEYYFFLWCVLNFVETNLEQLGAWLEKTDVVKDNFYDKLSLPAVRRVRAVMSVPMFLMSVFAIFYFFGGTGSGSVFLHQLLIDIPWDSFVVFLTLVYCAVQNAMEVERLGLTKLKVREYRD